MRILATHLTDVIHLFSVNRDAPATNRGFYYQFLSTLYKWTLAFANGTEVEIFTEVDEDIKEVGNELIFTQVKSYVDTLNLNSEVVQSTLFNFYILFLKYSQSSENVRFIFQTNTGVKKGEALLKDWMKDGLLADAALHRRVAHRLKDILAKQFKNHRDKIRSNTKKSDEDKVAIMEAYHSALLLLSGQQFDEFVRAVSWEFASNDPHAEIDLLHAKIMGLLERPIFKGISPNLLVDRLFTEIHKRSTIDDPAERRLTVSILGAILNESLATIESSVNHKLKGLLGSSYFELMTTVKRIDTEVREVVLELANLRSEMGDSKNSAKRALPKELTHIPKLFPGDLIGRESEVNAIRDRLKSTDVLCVNGDAGIGKSSTVAGYVQVAGDDFDHIIWVKGGDGFRNAFIFDELLIQNIGAIHGNALFDEIVARLHTLPGSSLIVIDDLILDKSEVVRGLLNRLRCPKCQVVICSRERFHDIPSYEILPLSEDVAFELTRALCPSRTDDRDEVVKFLRLIEFNTLMIELCATTIEFSADLTFTKIVEILQEKELDSDELQVDISMRFSGVNTRLFSYLRKTVSTARLGDEEHSTLEVLAVLPSEILIDDYIFAYGKKEYDKNKVTLSNLLNALHRKGWIRKTAHTVKMHKLIQIVMTYNSGGNFYLTLFVNFLCHRLRGSIYSLDFSRPGFIAMAESIIKAIPRHRRNNTSRQALIILELDLLEVYRQIGEEAKFIVQMLALVPHAEEVLVDDQENLGAVYTNASMAFQLNNDHENAVRIARRGVELLSKYEAKKPADLFHSISNLISILLYGDDPLGVPELIDRAVALHSKYLKGDELRMASFLNAVGGFYLRYNQLDEAEQLFKGAVALYKKLRDSQHDYFLAMSYSNLSMTCLYGQRLVEAVQYQTDAINVLEKKGLPNNPVLRRSYAIMAAVFRQMGDAEKAKAFEEKSGLRKA